MTENKGRRVDQMREILKAYKRESPRQEFKLLLENGTDLWVEPDDSFDVSFGDMNEFCSLVTERHGMWLIALGSIVSIHVKR
jgi:hypothetical protein